MMIEYIGLSHEYGTIDCIHLIQLFYKEQLGINFDIPSYSFSKRWVTEFTTQDIDLWAFKYGIKTTLTDAQNYDLIAFKSENKNTINHFGMFLAPNRMLHIEENSISRIETLNDYWLSSIYAIYRHEQLVR